jgi:hypothetical protein
MSGSIRRTPRHVCSAFVGGCRSQPADRPVGHLRRLGRGGDVVTGRVAERVTRSVGRIEFLGYGVAVTVAAAALAVAGSGLRLPAHVEELAIDNPHPWPAHVQVTDADRGRWLGIGTIGRGTEKNFLDTGDQGELWIFRFSYAGESVELRVPASKLEDDDWRLTVPETFAENLHAARVPHGP